MAPKISVFSIFLLFIGGANLVCADDTGVLTQESLAVSINKFGCNLLNGVYKDAKAEDNVLVSPVNVYAALALLHLGAGEKTRKELSTVMELSENVKNSTEMHERLSVILSQLSPPKVNDILDATTAFRKMKQYEMKLANGLFLQKDFSIKARYVELAKKYYDSLAENLDFVEKAKESTDTINHWISEKTNGRISKFYEDPLASNTIAVLVSALYFNAKWSRTFEVDQTKTEKFNTGLKEIEVPMMNMERRLSYSTDNTLHYDSVSLPYSGKENHMTIYLQHTEHGDHGSLAHLFHTLADQNFAPNTTQTSERYVNLKLPKMKFSWKNSVVDALKLRTIFDTVDLEEMTSTRNVKVSDMMHATEMEVDEKGTIASAATTVEIGLTSGFSPDPREPVKFHVNRPYLVTISNQPNGIMLFAGIVRQPTK